MVFLTDFMEKHAFDIRFAAESNIGLHRSNNEDSFVVCRPEPGSVLACVADGIGSHTDGKLASSICCRELLERVLGKRSQYGSCEEFLKNSFDQINTRLFERNYREKRPRPMGCTAVSAFFAGDEITLLNIGDSSFYEYIDGRDKPLKQITVDHHLGEDHLEKLSREYQVDKDVLRHRVLLHSLGTRQQINPDIFTLALTPGAKYLLCSDGLSGRVPEERIQAIMANDRFSCRELTSALVREALVCGGRDNITVITVSVSGEADASA